jgi:hypothetical protein
VGVLELVGDLRSPHLSSTAASDLQFAFEHESVWCVSLGLEVARSMPKARWCTYGLGSRAHHQPLGRRSLECGTYLERKSGLRMVEKTGAGHHTHSAEPHTLLSLLPRARVFAAVLHAAVYIFRGKSYQHGKPAAVKPSRGLLRASQ